MSRADMIMQIIARLQEAPYEIIRMIYMILTAE